MLYMEEAIRVTEGDVVAKSAHVLDRRLDRQFAIGSAKPDHGLVLCVRRKQSAMQALRPKMFPGSGRGSTAIGAGGHSDAFTVCADASGSHRRIPPRATS